MKYFEPITLFAHKVLSTEHPNKLCPRISVDMGLSTFLTFAMNEAYIFGLKYGPEKAAYLNDKDRVLALLNQARNLVADLDKYYTSIDYFESNPHLQDLVPRLKESSYSPDLWDYLIKTVESYESITES